MNLEFEIALEIAHKKIDVLQSEIRQLKDALAEVVMLMELSEDYIPTSIYDSFSNKNTNYQKLIAGEE